MPETSEHRERTDAERLTTSVRLHAVGVVERELARALGELDGLTPTQRRTVAAMARRIVARSLAPAREAAAADDARAAAIRRLFDPEPVRDRT